VYSDSDSDTHNDHKSEIYLEDAIYANVNNSSTCNRLKGGKRAKIWNVEIFMLRLPLWALERERRSCFSYSLRLESSLHLNSFDLTQSRRAWSLPHLRVAYVVAVNWVDFQLSKRHWWCWCWWWWWWWPLELLTEHR